MIFDRFDLSNIDDFSICIVGAGPVGLALALRLSENGIPVILLEASGMVPEPSWGDVFDMDNVNPLVHADRRETSRQGLGGTSSVWGGGCSPYTAYDFEERAQVPHSGAPISYSDLGHYYDEASAFFGVGNDFYEHDNLVSDEAFSADNIMRIAPVPNMANRHIEQIRSSANLRLFLNTRVTGMQYDPRDQKITQLDIISGSTRASLTPRSIAICCGGVQTARMLLLLQREHPMLWGGPAGPLGRFYMGHLSGSIARIAFADPKLAEHFLYKTEKNGQSWRRHLSPTPQTQAHHRLLNMYFSPANFPLGDPGYKSGAMSALHLALSIRHGTTDYMRHYRPGHAANAFDFGLNAPAHCVNLFRNPARTVTQVARVALERMSAKSRPIGFQLKNPNGIYALHFHSEQFPNPESRVTLSDRYDSDGTALPRVDLKFTDEDVGAILRAHDVFADWFAKKNLGLVTFRTDESRRLEQIQAQTRDGFHQMGLIRMSDNPKTGVVDANLAAFGVSNLFLAGTGVLPMGSQAHPTFTAASLAMRLADHLRIYHSASPTVVAS